MLRRKHIENAGMIYNALFIGGHANGRVSQFGSVAPKLEIPMRYSRSVEHTVPVRVEPYTLNRLISHELGDYLVYLSSRIPERESRARFESLVYKGRKITEYSDQLDTDEFYVAVIDMLMAQSH
jgi:hypothetical protein